MRKVWSELKAYLPTSKTKFQGALSKTKSPLIKTTPLNHKGNRSSSLPKGQSVRKYTFLLLQILAVAQRGQLRYQYLRRSGQLVTRFSGTYKVDSIFRAGQGTRAVIQDCPGCSGTVGRYVKGSTIIVPGCSDTPSLKCDLAYCIQPGLGAQVALLG